MLIKTMTAAAYPDVGIRWNSKLMAQIYNLEAAHFMQFVFVFGGAFSVQSMRMLIAMNSSNCNNVRYLLSNTNFKDNSAFWSLWDGTSLFMGLLNNASGDVVELILTKMQQHYDGANSERILNECCIGQFVRNSFSPHQAIFKRLLWIMLKTSKFANADPFRSIDVVRYGIPSLCKSLDAVKLRFFMCHNLVDPMEVFKSGHIRELCAKDEDARDYERTMRFLVVLFDWITVKCQDEPEIQESLERYHQMAVRYR